ncbi:MAG TPA: STAS domain-containing protein [Steroidobacteraceae bacterium]|nr:STAS domain-containing protein [Steroidobacteraceae bacterium]
MVLGPALTIAEVAGCARGFAAMLAGGTAQADARALESIDTAGLQLLLAAAAAAQQRGLKLTLRGAPELLTGAADALGVGGELSAAVELSA